MVAGGGGVDYELNSTGIEQAKALSVVFKERNYVFNAVYSSDLVRAKQTAVLATGVEPITDIRYVISISV